MHIISKIGVRFEKLDASKQKELLRKLVERVVVDPSGMVVRMELLPPFSYLHQLTKKVQRNGTGGNEKTSEDAGSCSTKLSSGGPEGLRYVH
ncbi:MAG: hypothetical protein KDA17_07135 [Candidatus Saccharibacteria bacterium]|nr:hypothetical protein [Candidatus Saccharibacteria bacterium]